MTSLSIRGAVYVAFMMLLTSCTGRPIPPVAHTNGGQIDASHLEQAPPEQDRQAILAMAGAFDVKFDIRETVPFVADYKLFPAKILGGQEVVRVIEDTGKIIRLQHLLVVQEKPGAAPIVVKHWRQDWEYQPSQILTYVSEGHWALRSVSQADQKNSWSQTVYQTDDSPRYGAVGRWAFDDGVARWTSEPTLRPLARRDAVRHPPYDHYMGVNRHAITPNGWVQEEDNAKIGVRDGKNVTFAHESVINSYSRTIGFPIAAADDYWAKTRDYWLNVRADWAERLAADKQLIVPESAEEGSSTGARLGELADDIVDGAKTTGVAAAAAKAVIDTTPRP